MELSPNKREEALITVIRLLSLSVLALTLFFYHYLHNRVTMFLIGLMIFILVLSRLHRYKRLLYSILFYAKILFVFLPISLSLNFMPVSTLHLAVMVLLFVGLLLAISLDNLGLCRVKNKFYIVLTSIFFLLTLISLVVFYPIKSEYQTSIEILQLVYKSLYLITLLFLLYHIFGVLESYRHIYHSGIGGVINSDNTLVVCSILILSLSLYNVVTLRTTTNEYLRSSVIRSTEDLLDLSRRLYIKGMHRENINLLYNYIERGMLQQDPETLTIIDTAQKRYPYECVFFNQRIRYLSRSNRLDELERAKKSLPATLVKRGCLIEYDE